MEKKIKVMIEELRAAEKAHREHAMSKYVTEYDEARDNGIALAYELVADELEDLLKSEGEEK